MAWVHGVQLLLSAIALAVAARSLIRLYLASAVDTRPLLEAVSDGMLGNGADAFAVLSRFPHSAVARLAHARLTEEHPGQESDVVIAQLRHEAFEGVAALRTLGRMASPLAFIGVMVEMGLALTGGQGLVALQRGLAERIALEHAAVGVAIGVATSVVCLGAAATLQRGGRERLSDLRLTLDIVDTARKARAET